MNRGKLYVCPTPIGNLEDITLRVIRVLQEVDLIAAEDTRHSIKLLNHLQIQKPLTSYHEHNEEKKGEVIIEKLKAGERVALLSDAGMPGISDPGQVLIRQCIEEKIEIEVLPGATAGILALVASGLKTSRFAFEGFLDRDKKKRRERLRKIKKEDRTLIFYEAPHRIQETLEDMVMILGNRRAAFGRELTKKYEEFVRGTLEELVDHFKVNTPRGEFVLLCEGASIDEQEGTEESFENITVEEHLRSFIQSGLDKKEAIKRVAQLRNIPKREVYKAAIHIE